MPEASPHSSPGTEIGPPEPVPRQTALHRGTLALVGSSAELRVRRDALEAAYFGVTR